MAGSHHLVVLFGPLQVADLHTRIHFPRLNSYHFGFDGVTLVLGLGGFEALFSFLDMNFAVRRVCVSQVQVDSRVPTHLLRQPHLCARPDDFGLEFR